MIMMALRINRYTNGFDMGDNLRNNVEFTMPYRPEVREAWDTDDLRGAMSDMKGENTKRCLGGCLCEAAPSGPAENTIE